MENLKMQKFAEYTRCGISQETFPWIPTIRSRQNNVNQILIKWKICTTRDEIPRRKEINSSPFCHSHREKHAVYSHAYRRDIYNREQ